MRKGQQPRAQSVVVDGLLAVQPRPPPCGEKPAYHALFGVKSSARNKPEETAIPTATTRKPAEPAAVRITKDIDRALSSAAKDFKTTRASIVKRALLEYLEDLADSKAIAEAQKKEGKMIPFSELREELGL